MIQTAACNLRYIKVLKLKKKYIKHKKNRHHKIDASRRRAPPRTVRLRAVSMYMVYKQHAGLLPGQIDLMPKTKSRILTGEMP